MRMMCPHCNEHAYTRTSLQLTSTSRTGTTSPPRSSCSMIHAPLITSPRAGGGALARAQQQCSDQPGADGVVGAALFGSFLTDDCVRPIAAIFDQLIFGMGKVFKIVYLHRNQLSE